ncbi:lipase family protein [Nocardia sp. XZ_19_385]|uniref:lipase family protein n=1 Tax=Nocardia sp. XZ_19_385 TaxID=2769488 RepID=UPI0018903B6A|nr:lipase family protein [Nocardia sp. XZ_19_385]
MRSPQAPGTVLRRTELPRELWPDSATAAYRVSYRGTDYSGRPQIVTASVFVPPGSPPSDGWPVIGYAHGTTGLGTAAAPSRTGFLRLELDHIDGWLTAGNVVAATDYEGLSAPGPHPYFNGEAVADDVVDAVRAARGIDHPVSPRWMVVGFSQGGHAALHVALMATGYAPELDFRGGVALCPPVYLSDMIAQLTRDPAGQLSPIVPILLAGLTTSHPAFDPAALLSGTGRGLLDRAKEATFVDMMRACAGVTNAAAGVVDLTAEPIVQTVLTAATVPAARLDRPMFLAGADLDLIVPEALVDRYATASAGSGSAVHYVRCADADHAQVLDHKRHDAVDWARTQLTEDAIAEPAYRGFHAMDATNDGYLRRDDFEAFALRLIQALRHSPGTPTARAVRDGYLRLWRGLSAADTNGDNRISAAEYRQWIHGRTAADFDDLLRPLAESVLALIDSNGDGVLSRGEFNTLCSACRMPKEIADREFELLDTDHNGTIDVDEIVVGLREFCRGADAPGQWLFGHF